mgnify:CR=1 FL=1
MFKTLRGRLMNRWNLKFAIRLVTLFSILTVVLSNSSTPFLIRGQGYSMFPTITHDSIVLTVPYSILKALGYEPRVGDIIVFNAPAIPPVWCHRIVGMMNGAYITKGDNNPEVDPFTVDKGDILAVVPQVAGRPLTIPKLGYIIGVLHGNPMLAAALIVSLMASSLLMDRLDKRAKRSDEPFKFKVPRGGILLLIGLLLFSASFLPSLGCSGYIQISYQVEVGEGIVVGDGDPLNFGVVKLGSKVSEPYTFRNGWILPSILCLRVIEDPYGEVSITPSCVVIPPLSSVTVNVTVRAKSIHGLVKSPIAVSIAPYLLPTGAVYNMLAVSPFLPSLIEAVLLSTLTISALHMINRRRTELLMRKPKPSLKPKPYLLRIEKSLDRDS